MRLVSVYGHPDGAKILYEALKAREGATHINISHNGKTPPWREHLRFFRSKPYRVWFVIVTDDEQSAGTIYLSKQDEIGVFIFERFRGRGLGSAAVRELMERTPRRRYVANINPKNEESIRFFERMGFKHVQNTYARER